MEAPAFHISRQFPLFSASTRWNSASPVITRPRISRYSYSSYRISINSCSDCIRKTKELKVSVQKRLEEGYLSLALDKVPRRAILQFVGVNVVLGNVCTALAAPMQEMKEPNVLRTMKLTSGVIIQDIVDGQGREAREEDTVQFNYVCRRSNGYFVHSTVDQFTGESSPVILRLDDEQIIKGLKEVLIGMKVGGKRRALLPPSVGYVSETLQPIPEEFGPRRSLLSHAKEPLIFEVQLLKII